MLLALHHSGRFLTAAKRLSEEYPDAELFSTVDAARHAVHDSRLRGVFSIVRNYGLDTEETAATMGRH